MKVRLIAAAAVVVGLAAPMSGAQAATATLDGKKVKVLTLKAVGAPQAHDDSLVTGALGGPERVECVAPRCARLDFLYKPAKGVKGNVAFDVKWSNPTADIDLYVAEIGKSGPTQLAACGATLGTTERIYLSAANFKAGKKYAVIADFYRTANEAVTATVTMPGVENTKKSVPAMVAGPVEDNLLPLNCGL